MLERPERNQRGQNWIQQRLRPRPRSGERLFLPGARWLPIRPRWRKVLRDLLSNAMRTLLVVFSIAVGVFAIGTIVSSRLILSSDLSAGYAATNPASAILRTAPFDAELVEAVRRMDGVREAEGRRRVAVRLKIGPAEWRDLRLEAVDDYDDMRVDKIRPESGAWPPPERELLIERASLGLIGARVGDNVLIETSDGKQHQLRVAGLTHDLNKIPARFSGTAYGYITFDTLELLGYARYFDELHVLVGGNAADKAHIQAVVDQVKDEVEKGRQTVYRIWLPEPGEHPADDILQPMVVVLGALAVLSLFLSGFLVVNTISALLAQQVRQIGIMKAVGGRAGQIARMYLGMVLIFGLLSLTIAVPLSALVSYTISRYMAGLINFDLLGFRIPLHALALEVAVGLLVPLAATLYPILAGVRVTVHEAINFYGLGKGQFGSNFFDLLLKHVRGIPRPPLLSLRNTFRRKTRLALTLATLSLGGAIIIAVFSVRASLLATLSAFSAYWNYDIDMDFDQSYRAQQIEREARLVPGVVDVELWGGNSARRVRADGQEGPSFDIVAPTPGSTLIQPIVIAGRWLRADDQNAIVLDTDVLKREPDIKVGDSIVLKIERRDATWRVVGIVQTSLTASFIRFGSGYVNYPHFARVARSAGRASNVRITTERHDPAFQSSVATALQAHFARIRKSSISIQTTASIREGISYQFNILVIFLSIMAAILAVVGALGLTGTMSLNTLERAREIGVMRAIGASDAAVLQIFLGEGVLIGLLSWPAATVLAVPIGKLLSDLVGQGFVGAPLDYTYSAGGALFWLVALVVLAALASFLPAWNAARMRVRDVLAYE